MFLLFIPLRIQYIGKLTIPTYLQNDKDQLID